MHNEEGRDKTIVELRTKDGDPDQVHDAAKDLQKFFGLFAERSREYGDHAFVLGSAGQYADMSRKFGKIKTAMWDKKPEQLTSESIEEVLMDMIGHCLLSIQCLRREGVLEEKPYRGQYDSEGYLTSFKEPEEKTIQMPEREFPCVDTTGVEDNSDPDPLSELPSDERETFLDVLRRINYRGEQKVTTAHMQPLINLVNVLLKERAQALAIAETAKKYEFIVDSIKNFINQNGYQK